MTKPLPYDAHFGVVHQKVDWRSRVDIDEEDDDELLPFSPEHIDMLGFDPMEEVDAYGLLPEERERKQVQDREKKDVDDYDGPIIGGTRLSTADVLIPVMDYDPNQPRDDHGRWTETGISAANISEGVHPEYIGSSGGKKRGFGPSKLSTSDLVSHSEDLDGRWSEAYKAYRDITPKTTFGAAGKTTVTERAPADEVARAKRTAEALRLMRIVVDEDYALRGSFDDDYENVGFRYVLQGGKVVAAINYAMTDNETGEIRLIGSTTKGTGAQLVSEAIAVMKDRGAKIITGEALQDAVPFWRKMGFEVTGDESKDIVPIRLLVSRKVRDYSPDQPRHPAGSELGGQFAPAGGGGGDNDKGDVISEERYKYSERDLALLNLARHTAKYLGYDVDKVKLGSGDAKFTLNGREYRAAGLAYLAGERHGEIEIFPDRVDATTVDGVMTHEIMHHKYQTVLDAHKAEYDKVMRLPRGETDDKDPMKPDGTLREPYDKQFPVYQAMTELSNAEWGAAGSFTGGASLASGGTTPTRMYAQADGVSDYSYEYWKGFADGTVPFHSAMHETLAEMARLKRATGKFPEHYGDRLLGYRTALHNRTSATKLPEGEFAPKPTKAQMDANAKIWRDLYRTVEKLYPTLAKKK